MPFIDNAHILDTQQRHHALQQTSLSNSSDFKEVLHAKLPTLSTTRTPFKTPLKTGPETPATGIQLTHSNIDDSGAILLSEQLKSSTDQALFLSKNTIGEIGTKALAQALMNNKTIKHLILGHNQINNFAAAGLADMLKVNRIIGWVILNNNLIGDTGAEALAEMLEQNDTVKHMVLSENNISKKGVAAFIKYLQHNKGLISLFLRGNPIEKEGIDDIIHFLNQPIHLKRLDLREIPSITPYQKTQLLTLSIKKNIQILL